MVGYEDARRAALSRVSDKTWFDFCTEYENAYVFSRYDDISFGGISPCAVMKDSGKCYSFVAVLDEIGEPLCYCRMDCNGALTEVSEEELNSEQKIMDLEFIKVEP